MGTGVKLFGEWDKAKKIVTSMQARFEVAAARATAREAQFLRAQMVKGIRDGNFAPLSPTTLALRKGTGFGGSKPLLRSGDMRNSIQVSKVGDSTFVGILRTAKGRGGESLANVAEIHEFGAGPFVVPVTPKSSRFYHAALRKAGLDSPTGGHGKGGGVTVAIVRIPARPFVQPVIDRDATPEKIRERFYASIAKAFGGDFGMPGSG